MTVRYDIALDWDGCIDSYVSGHKERPDIFNDPPVPGAIAWLTEVILAGKLIVINSTRLEHHDDVLAHEIATAMKTYLIKNGCPPDVAHALHFWSEEGKPRARVYIDDRGYRFEGTFPSVAELDGLDVWNRNDRIRARVEAVGRKKYEAQKAAFEAEEAAQRTVRR